MRAKWNEIWCLSRGDGLLHGLHWKASERGRAEDNSGWTIKISCRVNRPIFSQLPSSQITSGKNPQSQQLCFVWWSEATLLASRILGIHLPGSSIRNHLSEVSLLEPISFLFRLRRRGLRWGGGWGGCAWQLFPAAWKKRQKCRLLWHDCLSLLHLHHGSQTDTWQKYICIKKASSSFPPHVYFVTGNGQQVEKKSKDIARTVPQIRCFCSPASRHNSCWTLFSNQRHSGPLKGSSVSVSSSWVCVLKGRPSDGWKGKTLCGWKPKKMLVGATVKDKRVNGARQTLNQIEWQMRFNNVAAQKQPVRQKLVWKLDSGLLFFFFHMTA